MNRFPDRTLGAGMLVVVMVVIALIAIINTKTPCGMYKFSPASEIPGRCLSHYTTK